MEMVEYSTSVFNSSLLLRGKLSLKHKKYSYYSFFKKSHELRADKGG